MKKWYIALLVSMLVGIIGMGVNVYAKKSCPGNGPECCGDPSASCCPLK